MLESLEAFFKVPVSAWRKYILTCLLRYHSRSGPSSGWNSEILSRLDQSNGQS